MPHPQDNELTLVMEAAEFGDLAGLIKQTAASGASSLGEPLAWRYVPAPPPRLTVIWCFLVGYVLASGIGSSQLTHFLHPARSLGVDGVRCLVSSNLILLGMFSTFVGCS